MKRKLLFVAALAASVLGFDANAQDQPSNGDDMTSRIINPEINGEDGWTIDVPNGGNNPLLGTDKFEYWAGSATDGTMGGLFNYYQKITELPAGVYTVSAEMYNATNGEAGAEVNGACGLYGATATAEVFVAVTTDGETLTPYTTDEIVVTDGTLTIGIKNITNMGARWFVADNFKLTYVRSLEEGEAEAQPAKDQQAAIETAQDLAEKKMKTNVSEALQTAISDAEGDVTKTAALWTAIKEARNTVMLCNRITAKIDLVKKYSSSTTYADAIEKIFDDLEGSDARIQDLYYSCKIAELVEENATDYTGLILNAAITSTDFWTNSNTASGEQYTDAPDEVYLDRCNVDFNSNQTVKGLPAGKYYLKVATRASKDVTAGHLYIGGIGINGGTEVRVGINRDGNTDGELGNGWSWTEAEFTVSEKCDVLIGVWAPTANSWSKWAGVDDYHLTYVSKDVEITDAEFTAFVTTFDTDFSRTEGITAYKVKSATTTGVELEEITTAPVGTAVILNGEAKTYTIMQAKEAVTPIEYNLFYAGGNKQGDGKTIYALGGKANDPESVGFYLVADGSDIPADKGYLTIEGAQEVRAFIPIGGEATGIDTVVEAGTETEGAIYTVAGQRVAQPTVAGLYIVDGKKVWINK